MGGVTVGPRDRVSRQRRTFAGAIWVGKSPRIVPDRTEFKLHRLMVSAYQGNNVLGHLVPIARLTQTLMGQIGI
jgi:hypothetical protein